MRGELFVWGKKNYFFFINFELFFDPAYLIVCHFFSSYFLFYFINH